MSRVHVEPPGARLPRGPAPSLTSADLRLGAAAGAAALVLTSTGDAFVLALLLGVAAARMSTGATAVGVATALLARWGSSSLGAAAGAQAVLGPAMVLRPLPSLLSTTAAAVALLLVAPAGWWAPVFGAAAGLVAAGPAMTSVPNGAVRLAGLVVGAGLAYVIAPRLEGTRAQSAAPLLALAAVGLAVLA